MDYKYARRTGTLENIPVRLLHVVPHGISNSSPEFQHLIATWMQNASFLVTYIFWHLHSASHEMERSHSEVPIFTVTLETYKYTHIHVSVYTHIHFFLLLPGSHL